MDPQIRLLNYARYNKHVQESLDVIKNAFSIYPVENTCISFNGGKDCTAVLHLVHSAARLLSLNKNDAKLTAFYAKLPKIFAEENAFVLQSVQRYDLRLVQYSCNTIKESLFKLKEDCPTIEAIFIGSRKDDFKPGNLISDMQPTDEGWPPFMRINPILNWTYGQVWDFIRKLDIPYCDLYNNGYSSLGTQDNTQKNLSLLRLDKDGKPFYLPAWQLTSALEERVSRSSSMEITQKELSHQDQNERDD